MFHLLPGSTFVFVVHLTLFFAVIFKQWHLTWTVSWTYSCWIWWLAFGADVTFMVHWVLNVKNQSVDYTVASWLWAMYHSLHVFSRNQSICYDDGWCSSILHLATPPPSAPPPPHPHKGRQPILWLCSALPPHSLPFLHHCFVQGHQVSKDATYAASSRWLHCDMYSLVHKMLTQHCKAVWVPLACERFITVALFWIVFVIARLSSVQNVSHKNGECIFLKENNEYPQLW